MALGGRPKESGIGHRRFNFSIRNDIYEMLKKVPDRSRSRFIETKITPVLKQMDPGPSCEFLKRVDEIGTHTLGKAILDKDFEKVIATASMLYDLKDYRALCYAEQLSDEKSCEEAGGKWENGACEIPWLESKVSTIIPHALRSGPCI